MGKRCHLLFQGLDTLRRRERHVEIEGYALPYSGQQSGQGGKEGVRRGGHAAEKLETLP